jgi:hypothetical protein
MRPAWRSAWAMTASFAVVFGAAIAVFDYMFWPHCDRGEKVLARDDHGRSIVSVLEACTSLGTETAESIELQSASGDKKPIFKYEPNGGVLGCKGRAFPAAAEPSVDGAIRELSISQSLWSVVFSRSMTRWTVYGLRTISDQCY